MGYYTDDDGDWDDITYFGGCTCDHREDEHGWGGCEVPGCECKGHWEE